ncbi:MAG: toll/interleukin-1 receptor domain-containing protein [Methanomassiliicoccales archaeon]|nr:toll/interleukin-1 receptor domain-containing protein [Methanomassiliicoccales archaeon]
MGLLSVFISHSSSDYEVITKVRETLEVQGFHIYLAEEDVRAGTYLPAKIEDAIRQCDVVLAILTSKASKSA